MQISDGWLEFAILIVGTGLGIIPVIREITKKPKLVKAGKQTVTVPKEKNGKYLSLLIILFLALITLGWILKSRHDKQNELNELDKQNIRENLSSNYSTLAAANNSLSKINSDLLDVRSRDSMLLRNDSIILRRLIDTARKNGYAFTRNLKMIKITQTAINSGITLFQNFGNVNDLSIKGNTFTFVQDTIKKKQ